ncbi:helix-turn-helix domain-containing protein [Rathayibacter soli]|uniref:helix-turn-helix domain-containing protein n=1 Tax=Rathayibacter soli TaxID=3144168 RepID=UPI0027E4D4C9|nr:helix-turn-helix domain-containing protein [Glaciibacter superstes]
MAAFTGRSAAPVKLSTVPFPAVTLFIDLGDAEVVEARGGDGIRGSGVVGIGAAQLRVRARHLECLQVRLSPTLAYAVLGEAVDDLAADTVGLDRIWGIEAERLCNRVYEQPDWDDRFAIVESALAYRCLSERRVDAEVTRAWHHLSARHGRIRVEQLADDVGWSRKRLWSRFRSQIGITPKRAAQLVRFDRAAHLLASGQSAATVAAECGYTDQSHLNRDTTTLAGLTPGGVATARWLQADPVAWPSSRSPAAPIATLD